MGQYLDLLCDTGPSRIATRDISDQSAERKVRSLSSLMSQPEPADETGDPPEAPSEPLKPSAADRPIAACSKATEERAAIVELDGSSRPIATDPTWWHDQYAERAAMRQHDRGYQRAEAELLAWRELENRWNLMHGERVSQKLCAGCRRPVGTAEALDLIDGNRVHLAEGYECLIRHGERWRGAAARALVEMRLHPPTEVKGP